MSELLEPTSLPPDSLFRLLVESVEDYAIFLMDDTGVVQTWNEGAERILGYAGSEIIGKHHSLLYPPAEMRRGKPEYVLRVAAEEGKFKEENWRARKDGSRFWASVIITALRSPEDRPLGFAKVIRDLTERKQAEEDRDQLLNLERGARIRAEHVLEQLQAMQTITEAALAHLDLSDLLQALLERISEVLQVDTVAILLATDDGQWLVPRAAKGIEEEVEAEIHLPRGRGFAGRIAAEGRPIVLDDVDHAEVLNPILRQKGIRSLLGVPLVVEGEPLGVLHVGTLHTRRFTDEDTQFLQIAGDRVALAIDHARLYERAELARQAAEAAGQEIELRDEFLSVAAHELKTPVTSLRTAAQVILRQLMRGEEVSAERLTRMASVIDQGSERLSRLVNQLLDISRLEGGKLRLERSQIDVVALVRDVVERTQSQAPSADIGVQGAESLWLWADPLRIEQVLVNLLDNAVKYSPRGGEIIVECTSLSSELVQMTVRDQGIGIGSNEHEQIFERFYRVDDSERTTGLGLGLYISREIVERHGGRIWAESSPNGGARFVIQLPVDGVQSVATDLLE